MAVSPINLPTHQRAPRKLLITVAEWTEGTNTQQPDESMCSSYKNSKN